MLKNVIFFYFNFSSFHHSSTTCSILCLKSLLNILHSNAVFKDVFREVGLLEVLVTCLHRYAAILKEAFPDASDEKPGVTIELIYQSIVDMKANLSLGFFFQFLSSLNISN